MRRFAPLDSLLASLMHRTFRRSRRRPERYGRRFPWLRRLPLRLELLEDRIAPALNNWVGPAVGGDWNTATNWSANAVPGSGDDVNISITGTVTHSSASSTVRSVTST